MGIICYRQQITETIQWTPLSRMRGSETIRSASWHREVPANRLICGLIDPAGTGRVKGIHSASDILRCHVCQTAAKQIHLLSRLSFSSSRFPSRPLSAPRRLVPPRVSLCLFSCEEVHTHKLSISAFSVSGLTVHCTIRFNKEERLLLDSRLSVSLSSSVTLHHLLLPQLSVGVRTDT